MALGVWSRSVGESVKLILQSGRPYGTDTHQQLREHLVAFLDAYNFAKHMESIAGDIATYAGRFGRLLGRIYAEQGLI
jgi:hypothetical protein